MASKQMKILSNLPYQMLVEIAKRLIKLEDFTSFRSVSKSLRAAANDEYFEGLRVRQGAPYLMLPSRDGNENICDLYSFVEGESIVASVEVAKFRRKRCFESLGWLLVIEIDGSMSLLDPFSGTEIPLPHTNTFPDYEELEMDEQSFIRKMVLSSRPSETSDFVLMIIGGIGGHLAFWRLRQKAWKRIYSRKGEYTDVVYGGGEQYYVIGYPGIVWSFKLFGYDNHVQCCVIMRCDPIPGIYGSQNLYIVKTVDDSLLIITRKASDLSKDGLSFITTEFHVYEVDINVSVWKEIYSLGRMAIFLGDNSSIAVDVSKFHGTVIKANHIYFTYDDWEIGSSEEGEGVAMDSGVYNLETGAVEPICAGEVFLSKVSPSSWITPCF